METGIYPVKLLGIESNLDVRTLMQLAEKLCVCAHVAIHCWDQTYPYRTPAGFHHPVGVYDTYLCTPELLRALRSRSVVGCYRAALYRRGKVFGDYVTQLYALRVEADRNGNEGLKTAIKLLLNSLYGKWGQHGNTWCECDYTRPIAEWSTWSTWNADIRRCLSYRSIGKHVECEVREGNWLHAFPAIAAHVTSYGRERLREFIAAAGPSEVYYCDTDSVHCSRSGYEEIIRHGAYDASGLGMVRIAGEYDKAEYRGRKNYRLDDECTLAGANCDPGQWQRNRAEVTVRQRAGEILRAGPVPNPPIKTQEIDYYGTGISGFTLPNDRVHPPICGAMLGRIPLNPDLWDVIPF